MLEELYPYQVNATNKFLPVVVSPQRIVLTTMNYNETDKEFIELTPLDIPEEHWKDRMK